MSSIDIWLGDERLTKIQAARALNVISDEIGGGAVDLHNAHGDEIVIYPAHRVVGVDSVQPPFMQCPGHGGGWQEARRYAELMSLAAEIMELALELDAEES